MKDLFDQAEPLTPRDIGKKRAASKPKGYAARPGTGPAGETCGTCERRVRFGRFSKCRLIKVLWTHSRRTDVLVRSPACRHWEAA